MIAAQRVLLSAELLPLIQQFQAGLYEDLRAEYLEWRQLSPTTFDSVRGQFFCIVGSVSIALDEFFVDDLSDRSFLLHRVIRDGNFTLCRRWLQYDSSLLCAYTIDCAAAHGQLEILRWLHSNFRQQGTTDAMDFAALKGHEKVVRFFHECRTEG
jgi:hypothetical protein